jgi:hypothetical protein
MKSRVNMRFSAPGAPLSLKLSFTGVGGVQKIGGPRPMTIQSISFALHTHNMKPSPVFGCEG